MSDYREMQAIRPQRDPFAPEAVDEQITARLAGMAPDERETRLTQGVARLHALPPGADASLSRVRARLQAAPLPADLSAARPQPGSRMNDMADNQQESNYQQRGRQMTYPAPTPRRTDTSFNRTPQPPTRAAGMRRTLSAVAAVAVVALVVAGFFALSYGRIFGVGAGKTPTVTQQTATAGPTETPTTAPLTFAPPASATDAQACRTILGIASTSGTYYDFGQGIVGMVNTGLTYPGYKLPDNLPLAPYKVAGNGYDTATNTEFAGTPPVDATTGQVGGVTWFLCNVGTQAVTLQRINARLDSFTAYTGALNVWYPCDGTAWYGPNTSGGGCGGGMSYDVSMQGAFDASATTGSIISLARTNTAGQNIGSFPFSFSAGARVVVGVGLTLPTAPGVYGFSFGLTANGAQTEFAPAWTTLSAPPAHKWDGQACSNYASQIPAEGNPPTYYVCPAQ